MARKTSTTSYTVATRLKHDKVVYERGATFPADAATPEQIEALLKDGVLKEPEASSGGPSASNA